MPYRVATTGLIADGAITEAKLAADAVTWPKIKNANVTENKIGNGQVKDAHIKSGNWTWPAGTHTFSGIIAGSTIQVSNSLCFSCNAEFIVPNTSNVHALAGMPGRMAYCNNGCLYYYDAASCAWKSLYPSC